MTVRRAAPRAAAGVAGLLATLLLLSCTTVASPSPADVPQQLRVEVVAELPHDTAAFTQGFELVDGVLYEGTGLVGRSQLRELDPETGTVRRSAPLTAPLFGEGLTVVGPRIWQLTWTDGVAIEWDRVSLTELRRVAYDGEGWGLCHDANGGRLVMSDGTDRLQFRDPVSFAPIGSIAVRMDGQPLTRLNELECVDGHVWANVFQTDQVVLIDPGTGAVTATVDAAGLLPASRRSGTDVLNGIAAVPSAASTGPSTGPSSGELLLTGKFWPTTFRVRFVPTEPH